MRLLVDTNVFVDFLLLRQPFGEEAKKFFFECWAKKHQIMVSSMSLRDIDYLVSRLTHSRKNGKEALFRAYRIATKVISIEADDAISGMLDHDGDFEDAMLIEAAERCFCDAIVSNNEKDFVTSKVPVFSPKRINEIWQQIS